MIQNKVIITGSANGIGKAIAKKLYQEGTSIIACDVDKEGLNQLRDEIKSVKTFHLDITDYDSVASFFKKIESFSCNWLFNNAGIYLGKNIIDYDPAEVMRVFKVNCMGAIYFTQLFANNLLSNNQKGAIVNISSVSAQEGSSDAIYGMTKAALLGLTKSTALNFAPSIRVNTIAPALVETSIIKNVPKERLEELRGRELLPDPITPDDIAESVYFLLSDKSKNLSGMTLDINNGQYMR